MDIKTKQKNYALLLFQSVTPQMSHDEEELMALNNLSVTCIQFTLINVFSNIIKRCSVDVQQE